MHEAAKAHNSTAERGLEMVDMLQGTVGRQRNLHPVLTCTDALR